MNVQVREPRVAQPTRLSVVDCDIHPLMRTSSDVRKYLPARWQEHYDVYGMHTREPFAAGGDYPDIAPHISRRDAYPPSGGPPGSDLAFMRQQFLDPFQVEVGVLQVLSPSGTNQRNLEFGAAVASAANDWQVAEWTSQDKRLRGSIVVTQDYPEAAVAEITRCAGNSDFVQVGMIARTQEPMGRRRYWPIFAAAAEHDLPLGVHAGGRNGHSPLGGGGWPSYYAEQHHLTATGMQTLVASMVLEGVFEEFPSLRLFLVEGGFTWLPALGWRLDKLWERMRSEVPSVKRPPSEYIRENCWFSTQPMEAVSNPQELRDVFDWVGWDRLCYSSDYPHWDFDDPRYAFPFPMTAEQKQLIFSQNARKLFRLG
jgi:predicted TIM-barrel fold metal-dependent hydrolase